MTKIKLYHSLNYVNHSRQKRKEMSDLVLKNPNLVLSLLEIISEVNDPISCKAAWVLEFVTNEQLNYIFPFLDKFIATIGLVRLESSVRPMAKICEYLVIAYYSKTTNTSQEVLKEHHLEQIATACFDWLIGQHKVAVKVYSMSSLCLLGHTFNWIHPELRMVLEQDYAEGSAAYKARARMTLAKMNKQA